MNQTGKSTVPTRVNNSQYKMSLRRSSSQSITQMLCGENTSAQCLFWRMSETVGYGDIIDRNMIKERRAQLPLNDYKFRSRHRINTPVAKY